MTDIFYLFGFIYIARALPELYYYIFKQEEFKENMVLPQDMNDGINEGISGIKDSLKRIPQNIISILFSLWIVTGIIYTPESSCFIIMLSILVIVEARKIISSIFHGYNMMFRGTIPDKNNFYHLALIGNILRHSSKVILTSYILFLHFLSNPS